MTGLNLQTIDRVALHGERGPVMLSDPRQFALLIRLAGAPGCSLTTDEILLCIWPHLPAKAGLAQLRDAGAAVARASGVALVTEVNGRWALDPTAVQSDLGSADPAQAGAFLAGFSVADTPEWDAWVTATRQEIASRAEPRRRHRRRFIRIAAVLVAIGVGALGYRMTRLGVPAGFSVGDRVILADIENLTGDTTLGRTLQTAALVGLQQSTRIDLYSRGRILESLKSIGRTAPPGALTLELALEVAVRDGAPWVVAIQVRPDQGQIRVTTRLVRAGTGESMLTLAETAAMGANPVTAVDRTLRGLQRGLGESARELEAQPPLAFATTADLEALRAYTDGSTAWRRGDFELAENYWQRSLALDTGFAMAMGSLGRYYYLIHRREDGRHYYQQALARLGRLTLWERLRIEEGFADGRGDLDSALTISRRTVQIFPRADTYYDLGTSLLGMDRCPEALAALERSKDLDPGVQNTHVNIATCLSRLRQYDAARQAYLTAAALDSTILYGNNVNLEYAEVLLLGGRGAEAESALVRMSRRPGMNDQALGYRGLGYLAMWRGDATRAREQFGRAATLSRQQGAAPSLLRNLVLVAVADRIIGTAQSARSLAEADSVVAATAGLSPGFLGLVVGPHADDGDGASVRSLLGTIRRRAQAGDREDSLLIQYVTGTLALLERDPRAALGAFALASGFRYPVLLDLGRASAYREVGRLDSARALLSAIIDSPVFGSEDQFAWDRAQAEIGEVEERLGRPDQAIASYRRFLERWKDGDPNLPDLIRIRARLATLVARNGR